MVPAVWYKIAFSLQAEGGEQIVMRSDAASPQVYPIKAGLEDVIVSPSAICLTYVPLSER